jgi:hypothetical protein
VNLNVARQSRTPLIGMASMLVAILCVMVIGTRWGLGVGPDSMSYLGYFPHDPGLPPLYTALVATSRLVDLAPASLAWLINLMCYAGTVGAIFLGVKRASGSQSAAYVAAFLVLTLPNNIHQFVQAESEPLFFFLTGSGFYLLSRFLEENSWRLLTLSALVVGLSTLARYPGVVTVALGAFLVLAISPSRARQRILRAGVFGVIGFAPFLMYFAYIKSQVVLSASGNIAGRSLGLHGNADLDRYVQGARSLMALVLPSQVPDLVRAAALIFILSAIALLCILYLRSNAKRLVSTHAKPFSDIFPVVTIGFAVGYMLFLLLAIQIEPNLPLSRRYATPVYLGMVPGAAVLAQRYVFQERRSRVIKLGLLIFVALLAASNTSRAISVLSDQFTEGSGFAARAWSVSPIIAHLKNTPYPQTIYSNGPDAIAFLTHAQASGIPQHTHRRTGAKNPDFEQRVEQMRTEIHNGEAVLVWLDKITWRDLKLPTEDELIGDVGPLTVLHRAEDGRVYGIAPRLETRADRE